MATSILDAYLSVDSFAPTLTFYDTNFALPTGFPIQNYTQSSLPIDQAFAPYDASIETALDAEAALLEPVDSGPASTGIICDDSLVIAFRSAFQYDAQSSLPMEQDSAFYDDSTEIVPNAEARSLEPVDNDARQFGPLRCDHAGCKSKATFRGTYELNRHKQLHEKDPLICPVLGCNKPRRSPRLDKFGDHIRGHGELALVKCPARDCEASPQALHLFHIHLRGHEEGLLPQQCHSYEWVNIWAIFANRRICPISSCHKFMGDRRSLGGTEKLALHLAHEHVERDRQAQRSSVWGMGIDPSNCDFICPVCPVRFSVADISEEKLQLHVWSHCVDLSHLRVYLREVAELCSIGLSTEDQSKLSSVEGFFRCWSRNEWYSVGAQTSHPCSICQHDAINGDYGTGPYYGIFLSDFLLEHTGLFIQNETLREKRIAMLRIVPSLKKLPNV